MIGLLVVVLVILGVVVLFQKANSSTGGAIGTIVFGAVLGLLIAFIACTFVKGREAQNLFVWLPLALWLLYMAWQIGGCLVEDNRLKNERRRREADYEAKKPIFEAQARDRRRVGTILTQRFVAHELSADLEHGADVTLETAHRAWRRSWTVSEMRDLAENVGLRDFFEYDAYAIEMDSVDDDAALLEYGTMLGQIDIRLQELIREYGSTKRLRDLPEFSEIVRGVEDGEAHPLRDPCEMDQGAPNP